MSQLTEFCLIRGKKFLYRQASKPNFFKIYKTILTLGGTRKRFVPPHATFEFFALFISKFHIFGSRNVPIRRKIGLSIFFADYCLKSCLGQQSSGNLESSIDNNKGSIKLCSERYRIHKTTKFKQR